MQVGLGILQQHAQDANYLCNFARTFTVRHPLAALPRQVARVVTTYSLTFRGKMCSLPGVPKFLQVSAHLIPTVSLASVEYQFQRHVCNVL